MCRYGRDAAGAVQLFGERARVADVGRRSHLARSGREQGCGEAFRRQSGSGETGAVSPISTVTASWDNVYSGIFDSVGICFSAEEVEGPSR